MKIIAPKPEPKVFFFTTTELYNLIQQANPDLFQGLKITDYHPMNEDGELGIGFDVEPI